MATMQRYGATPHAAFTWKDKNGNIHTASDVRQKVLYTTIQLNDGDSGDLRAFAQGISSQIAGGTRNLQDDDTNLSKASTNGLDRDTFMDVYQIGVLIRRVMRANSGGSVVKQDTGGARSEPANAETLFKLNRTTFIRFYNAEKLQIQGALDLFPPGMGLTGFSTQSGREIVNNGIPSPDDRQAQLVPTQLKDGVGFWVDVKTAVPYDIDQVAGDVLSGGANLDHADLMIYFHGVGNVPVN